MVTERLRDAGHDAVHVGDLGLLTASDEEILGRATTDDRVIISADADVGTLLALNGLSRPSFILLRSADHLSPDQQVLLIGNLKRVEDELARGAILTLRRGRVRVRQLPIEP